MKTGRILKQYETKLGYYQLILMQNGKRKNFRVNRLVAIMFIPNDNPQEKTEVNHINENKHDNRVENLEWTTHLQNTRHGTGIERRAKTQGKKVKCVETGQIFDSIGECSRKMNLPQQNINSVCLGKRKTCGGYSFEYVD